jgi:hypothetical protein
MEDQEFLDFELRDGKEQNASLKLGLSKNLTLLDEQNFENDQARLNLSSFVQDFNTQSTMEGGTDPLGGSVVEGLMDQS